MSAENPLLPTPSPGPHSLAPAHRQDPDWSEPIDASPVEASSRLNLPRLLTFLRSFWWVPVLTLLLAVGGVAAYVWKIPPTYISRSLMWETVKLRLPDGNLFSEDVQNFLGTQTELLKSRTLRDLAIDRLKITSTNPVPLGPDQEPLPVDIRVAGASKSSVFRIEAVTADPAYARSYLDALMTVFLEYKQNIRRSVSGDYLALITEQAQKAERELKLEQDALTAFQRTNNLAILEEEGRIAGGYLARLKTQLSDYQLEAKLLDTMAGTPATTESGEPIPSAGTGVMEVALGNTTLPSTDASGRQTVFKELEILRMQRERLSRHLRPKHPKMVRLNNEIDRAEKLLDMYRRQSLDQLAAAREALRLRTANVESSIGEWEAKVVQANSRIADAELLRDKVQRAQRVFDGLDTILKNVGISRNIDQETLAILEPARVAERTYAKEIRLLALAAGGGLAMGLGIVLLVAFRDDRLLSSVEVLERVGAPVIGQVPRLKGLKRALELSLTNPQSSNPEDTSGLYGYAESFRSLRSALLFMPTDATHPRVILITSAQPHEGKSTIAANLAQTLAKAGSHVILVDADLRKGVRRSKKASQPPAGLSDALLDPSCLDAILQTLSDQNPAYLSRGNASEACADRLVSGAIDLILARLRRDFDYVILDCSPVFAADDAAALAPKADGTLMVVRRRYSGAAPVREALDQLLRRNARILGVILNEVDASTKSYYYYKYAGYDTGPENPKTTAA